MHGETMKLSICI